ncbi:MAG: permease [Actinomycetota bacterium]|nr:permease [Actinomycetota bacterium]
MTDTRYDNTGREAYVAPTGAGSNVNVTTGDGGWFGNGVRDRVRWGPIWAGLLTAIATFLLLSTAAVAIGAQAVSGGADGDAAGTAGGIVTAIIALLAFLAGGFVAGRTAGVVGRGYGALNGFLVWALGIVLILALAAMGLGSLFGASGDLFAQYQQMGSPQPEGVDPEQVAEGIRNGSIGAFIGMLLPAIAATVGGLLGSREQVVVAA